MYCTRGKIEWSINKENCFPQLFGPSLIKYMSDYHSEWVYPGFIGNLRIRRTVTVKDQRLNECKEGSWLKGNAKFPDLVNFFAVNHAPIG